MKIITCAVHPIFIELQQKTLLKWLVGGEAAEFIVFNDAVDFPDYTNGYTTNSRANVEKECRRLNIPCFNLIHGDGPAYDWGDPCFRCAYTMNRLLEWQRSQSPDEYLLIDSDMILVAPFDIAAWRKGFAAVVLQTRPPDKIYFWNGLVYFDFLRLPKQGLLNWDFCPGCDVGGKMQDWLLTVGHRNILTIQHLCSGKWNTLPEEGVYPPFLLDFLQQDPRNSADGAFFCELYEGAFLHFRAGSGWMGDGGAGLNVQRTLASKMSAIIDADPRHGREKV